MPRAVALGLRVKRQHGQARHCDHLDAVDRAAGQAEFAAGTIFGDDRVHALARTDDCVSRTIVEASGATDAGLLVDQRDELRAFVAAVRIERQHRPPEQCGQVRDHVPPTGGATIQGALTARQRLGIGLAAVKPAAPALGLRQQRVDAFRQHR